MRGEKAAFRIRSDILDLKVCRRCALEARELRLQVEPLPEAAVSTKRRPMRRAA